MNGQTISTIPLIRKSGTRKIIDHMSNSPLVPYAGCLSSPPSVYRALLSLRAWARRSWVRDCVELTANVKQYYSGMREHTCFVFSLHVPKRHNMQRKYATLNSNKHIYHISKWEKFKEKPMFLQFFLLPKRHHITTAAHSVTENKCFVFKKHHINTRTHSQRHPMHKPTQHTSDALAQKFFFLRNTGASVKLVFMPKQHQIQQIHKQAQLDTWICMVAKFVLDCMFGSGDAGPVPAAGFIVCGVGWMSFMLFERWFDDMWWGREPSPGVALPVCIKINKIHQHTNTNQSSSGIKCSSVSIKHKVHSVNGNINILEESERTIQHKTKDTPEAPVLSKSNPNRLLLWANEWVFFGAFGSWIPKVRSSLWIS